MAQQMGHRLPGRNLLALPAGMFVPTVFLGTWSPTAGLLGGKGQEGPSPGMRQCHPERPRGAHPPLPTWTTPSHSRSPKCFPYAK